MLQCSDGSLYTGITTDVERRLKQHNGDSPQGAKFTRARRPVRLVYSEQQPDRSLASKREIAIKAMNRKQKLALIRSHQGLKSLEHQHE